MQITVDDTKTTVFVQAQRAAEALRGKQKAAEEALNVAQEAYNTAKAAAVRGMGPWDAVGPLHVLVMKKTQEMEAVQKLSGEAQNDFSSAKNVYVAEVLRAADAAVPRTA